MRTLAPIALAASFVLCFSGCAGMGGGGESSGPPPPNSPAEFASGTDYLRDGRNWYQLKVGLELPKKNWTGGSLSHIELDAEARLWRYNRRSKRYDIPLEERAVSRRGLVLTFDRQASGKVRILPANGTDTGSHSGLSGKNIGVKIDSAKTPDPDSPGNFLLVASGEAEIYPANVGERQRIGNFATARAIRKWRIDIDTDGNVNLEELPE